MSDGTCITKILARSAYGYLTEDECTEQMDELGLTYCYNGNDYYAGAAAACGGKSNLPSQSQLTALAQYLYNTSSINMNSPSYYNSLTLDTSKASALGLRSSGCFLWSNQENSSYSYGMGFMSQMAVWGSISRHSTDSGNYVACIEK